MDSAIFYSLAIINEVRGAAYRDDPEWGTMICCPTGHLHYPPKAKTFHYPYHNALNTDDLNALQDIHTDIMKEIQAHNPDKQYYRNSAKYYAESFTVLIDELLNEQLKHKVRIVEIGPQFGDFSCQIAGLLRNIDATLDLIDIDKDNLTYAYRNIEKVFPEVLPRVKLFYGDLPLYVKNIIEPSSDMNILHYQGSYNFNDVVRDLSSTYFAKEKIAGTFLPNLYLRNTNMNYYSFVDAAIYALFGMNIKYIKLGENATTESGLQSNDLVTTFLGKNQIEGMYIPYIHNQFRYPHPQSTLDDFIYKII